MKRLEPIYAWMDEKIGQMQDADRRWYSSVHAHGVAQISMLLAMKRGLNPEIAGAIGLLHDVSYVLLSSYERHDALGADMARVFLGGLKTFSPEEMDIVAAAIGKHDQDPQTFAGYDAILSEADFLEPYLRTQQPPRTKAARERLRSLLMELGLEWSVPPPDEE